MCGLSVGLTLMLWLLLAGCAWNEPPPAPDPWEPFRPGLRPQDGSMALAWETFPRYDLDIRLADDGRLLTGTGQIRVPNPGPDPWTSLVFRLYPNLDHYGGLLQVQSVAVDGRPMNFLYQAADTAIRIELPQVLLPGEQTTVQVGWSLAIPEWADDTPAAYRLFGISQGMTSLPLFYPSLAVYASAEADPARPGWWMDVGTVRGDAAFNRASLFVVTATLPSLQVPVASGRELARTQVDGYRTRYVWATGPTREFLLHLGKDFRSQSVEAYGTQVTSYWLPGQESAGRAALQYAAGALRALSDRFGPYPYSELRVAVAPLSFRGMEYPQVLLLGTQLYDTALDELELRTAHEVAHQWWYLLVHNDPVNHPWIDEGLAEYASGIYLEVVHGRSEAEMLRRRRWQAVVERLVAEGADAPLDLPVDEYASGAQYEAVVYGKGALFYHAIRRTLGDETFFAFLQEYAETYRYAIVEPSDLLEMMRRYDPAAADALWQEWIGEPP